MAQRSAAWCTDSTLQAPACGGAQQRNGAARAGTRTKARRQGSSGRREADPAAPSDQEAAREPRGTAARARGPSSHPRRNKAATSGAPDSSKPRRCTREGHGGGGGRRLEAVCACAKRHTRSVRRQWRSSAQRGARTRRSRHPLAVGRAVVQGHSDSATRCQRPPRTRLPGLPGFQARGININEQA